MQRELVGDKTKVDGNHRPLLFILVYVFNLLLPLFVCTLCPKKAGPLLFFLQYL